MPKTKKEETPINLQNRSIDFYKLAIRYKESFLRKRNEKFSDINLINISQPYKSKLLNTGDREVEIGKKYEVQTERKIADFVYFTDEFIKLVKTDPSLVINDYVIKRVIQRFQTRIYTGPRDRAIIARETLSKAQLSLFIPKDAPKKYNKNVRIDSIKARPIYLYIEVESTKDFLSNYYKPPYRIKPRTGEKHRDDKKSDIAKAFKKRFDEDLPKYLFQSNRDKDITNIALTFASYSFDIDYPTIKSVYFENKKSIEDELLKYCNRNN